MKKIMICFIIFLNVLTTTSVYASENGILGQAREFIQAGEEHPGMNKNQQSEDTTKFGELAGLLQGTGILIAVGTAIVLGIRFMMASASKRSEILQSVTPFIIGTIVILGAVVIWKVVIEVLDVV